MWGAVVGDIAGSRFEGSRGGPKDFELFHRLCTYTDDTVCTAAIADIVLNERNPAPTLQRWCQCCVASCIAAAISRGIGAPLTRVAVPFALMIVGTPSRS